MRLHDHFRPPLSVWRPWHGCHHMWATYIASELNARLPSGYIAQPHVQFGVEIDVAALEDQMAAADAQVGAAGGADVAAWSPPAPAMTIQLPLVTDVVETLVFEQSGGLVLAAAIELVSPANKDRPSHRDAFLSKCQAYLQGGLGLIVVDVVTERAANLHRALLERLDPAGSMTSLDSELYAAAYRPVEVDGDPSLAVWQESLHVDAELPTMPLWLRGDLCIAVDLAASYDRVCRDLRIADLPR